MGKLVCLPNQRYDAQSGKFGKIFVATISVEIDRIKAWKWNYEQVIVFQLVILQDAQAVNKSKHIRARIQFLLDLCNSGAFDELVKDTFFTFSNLILKRKLREAVRFVCARETGGVLQPAELA